MRTKSTNGNGSADLCHYDALTRTKFFQGMLLTDEHLRGEQTYHREALKRLNRYLWGPGIVCGLEVRKTNGLCIKIHPGFALDCEGNAIEICKSITLDLADLCRKKYPGGCAPEESPPLVKYLVLVYHEIAAEPEPVLTPDDECTPAGEGTKCEASKYREGFCLEFRDRCPHPDPCPDTREKLEGAGYGALPALWLTRGAERDPEKTRAAIESLRPDCMSSPPCPRCDEDETGVALARLEIDCAENVVVVTCGCRQYVWSGQFLRWLMCEMLAKIDRLPRQFTGLNEQSSELPAEKLFAQRPVEAAWQAATEYAAVEDPIRELQLKVAKLEEQLEASAQKQAGRQKTKDTKEP